MVTGMFRSGTTLLTRILNVHPEAFLVADVFLHFFKRFRDVVYGEWAGPHWRPGGPLEDGFLTSHRTALDSLHGADLSRALTSEDRRVLTGDIDDTLRYLHPGLLPGLADLHRPTFRDHFRAMMDVLIDVYASGRPPVCVGFKMCWLEHFIPAMARAFPEMRFVMLYRDVRAVTASQNAKAEKRPLLFYARQWRKSVACMLVYTKLDQELCERVHPVCYEDLVLNPKAEMRALCDFLGLSLRSSMLDADPLTDETGRPWQPNTSYSLRGSERRNSFEYRPPVYTDSSERWKEVLEPEQTAYLEWLCGPELALLGYRPSKSIRTTPAEFLICPPEPSVDSLVSWAQDEKIGGHISNAEIRSWQLGGELARRYILESGEFSRLTSDDDGLLKGLFIFTEFYPMLREAWTLAIKEGEWS